MKQKIEINRRETINEIKVFENETVENILYRVFLPESERLRHVNGSVINQQTIET